MNGGRMISVILSNQQSLRRIFTYHGRNKEGTVRMDELLFEIAEILEDDMQKYLSEKELKK